MTRTLFLYGEVTYLVVAGPNASGYYTLVSRDAVTIYVHKDDKGLESY